LRWRALKSKSQKVRPKQASVLDQLLHMFEDEYWHWLPFGFELQAKVVAKGREQ